MSLRIASVVGARPQFVKAAVVSEALRQTGGVEEYLVHTGQHFDESMSSIFFMELGIPRPAASLGIGGGTHGQNTGRMIEAIERFLLECPVDMLVVYGDTDSTIAAAIAGSKMAVRIAHVEAGLRSFNRAMPEEINRVVTDHVSDILFTPTAVADRNLLQEGVAEERIVRSGDVMYDAMVRFRVRARERSQILSETNARAKDFVLVTLHRPVNVDDADNLRSIVSALGSSPLAVVWPVHPRTRKRLQEFDIRLPPTVKMIDPVGFLDMVQLETSSALIVTDSGGIQKEAFFAGVPCVTVRDETEWVELIDLGANRLVDSTGLRRILTGKIPSFPTSVTAQPYGNGNAGEIIADTLISVMR